MGFFYFVSKCLLKRNPAATTPPNENSRLRYCQLFGWPVLLPYGNCLLFALAHLLPLCLNLPSLCRLPPRHHCNAHASIHLVASASTATFAAAAFGNRRSQSSATVGWVVGRDVSMKLQTVDQKSKVKRCLRLLTLLLAFGFWYSDTAKTFQCQQGTPTETRTKAKYILARESWGF